MPASGLQGAGNDTSRSSDNRPQPLAAISGSKSDLRVALQIILIFIMA